MRTRGRRECHTLAASWVGMEPMLDRLGRRQHGLLTTPQLHEAGWSKDAIYGAVKEGDLFVVRRRVYRVAGAPITQELTWLAAVLAAERGVVLSGLSATQAFGFRSFPHPFGIDLLSPTDVAPRMPGVVGHCTISLPAYDVTHWRSIPITTPERTFIDSCGTVDAKTLGEAGDELQRRKVLWLPRMVKSFELIPASGRRKRRPMYGFFEARVRGYDPGGSDQELDVMKIIKSGGPDLVLPKQQYRVRIEGHNYDADYAWPETKHTLEWQGWWYHGKFVSDFHRDADRTRRFQRAGWTVWPVTSTTSANEILAIATTASLHELAA